MASVVVLKLDRLTRSVRDLADLIELFSRTETALVSVTEHLDTSSASGRLMMNLLASVSQWEREAISERTSAALAFKRKANLVYSPTPFGYRRDGALLLRDSREFDALKTVAEMRRCGATLRVIGEWLSTNGFPPKRGGRAWHPATVRRLLSSKMTIETTLSGVPNA